MYILACKRQADRESMRVYVCVSERKKIKEKEKEKQTSMEALCVCVCVYVCVKGGGVLKRNDILYLEWKFLKKI